jgi:signal transduction histidine kinase
MRLRALRALLVFAGVLFGLYGYHLLRHDLHSSVANAVLSIVVAWTFLFAGIVAWARRPHSRMGILMTVVAYCLLERKLQYSHDSAVFSFGFLFGELGLTAAFAHAVLAYPSGRLRTKFERRFIAASYALVVGFSLAMLAVWDHTRTCIWSDAYCAEPRPKSLFAMYPSKQAFDAIHDVYRIGVYGVLAVLFIALILRRVRSATPAGKRVLIPLMVAAVLAATRAVSEAILGFVKHSSTVAEAAYLWQVFGQIAVPIALLVGLLRAELARGTVADLVVELSHVPPGEVRDALARALHDDSLQVAYWLPMRRVYVDEAGRPVEVPDDGRSVTKLDDIAAIVHDPELDPGLVEAAGAAARLALHNARLQADVSAQLAKVQESRRRIVTAGDEQRRKIERDLHDGAQQRLVALALELRIAQRQFGKESPELERVLGAAVSELQVAVEELRELARGVHPAVLTEEGLGGARENGSGSGLRGLVDRVEAHGGTLRIESEPGEGTRVIGELPCAS